jgi:hypothetical protein
MMTPASNNVTTDVADLLQVDFDYRSDADPSASQLTGQTGQDKATIPVQDPEIRWDLVRRVKAEIAAGTYETPERIDATARRLAKVLFPNK